MRAHRLLDGVQLADKPLKVQIASKTQVFLDDYKTKVDRFLSQERVAGNPITNAYPFVEREQKDIAAKAIIDDMLSTIQKGLEEGGGGFGLKSHVELQTMEEKSRAAKRTRDEIDQADMFSNIQVPPR